MSEDWNPADAADRPTVVAGEDRMVTISGGLWTEATDELLDLYDRADNLIRLFGPEAARQVDDR